MTGSVAGGETEPVQVVGLVRFSYLGSGGFQSVPEDPDEAAAHLFDDTRMERRFRMFERVTIPSLAAQTDPDFTLVVLTAENLPAHHLERLRAAVAKLPNGSVLQLPAMPQYRAVREAVQSGLTLQPDLTAQFRLDDDDGLALDFVATLKRHAPEVARLHLDSETPGVGLDYTHGLRVFWKDGEIQTIIHNRRIHTSQGMTLVTRDRGVKTVMGYAHHKIWQHIPLVSLPKPLMYLQSSHEDQDSGMRIPNSMDEIPQGTAARLLEERFGLDLRALNAA
ncbi:glycosyltransferase [Halovulum sp. GXIMD14794]